MELKTAVNESNCLEVKFEIKSNWGHPSEIGLTEVSFIRQISFTLINAFRIFVIGQRRRRTIHRNKQVQFHCHRVYSFLVWRSSSSSFTSVSFFRFSFLILVVCLLIFPKIRSLYPVKTQVEQHLYQIWSTAKLRLL